MQLRRVIRGRARSLFTPGRASVATELERSLKEISRSHPRAVERILAALTLVADGVDPRDVADECSKLGVVLHWRWGDFRVAWFWGEGGRLIVLEVWRKKGAKERRERAARLNRLRARFDEEDHDYRD